MSLSRTFVIYTISSILSAVVPFVLIPLLTAELSVEHYGILATINSLITFSTPLIYWGVTGAVSVEFYKRPKNDFPIYFSSILRLPLFVFLLFSVLAPFAAPFISSELGIPAVWFCALPGIAIISLFPILFASILRMRDMPIAFASFEFISAVLSFGLTVFFVFVLALKWEARILAVVLTSAAGTAVSIVWLYREGYFTSIFSFNDLKDAFKFGAGLVPHDLANNAIRVADRLVLVALVGLNGAGQYAIATQISSVILILLSAFNRAWAPYLFAQLTTVKQGAKESIVKTSYAIVAVALAFIIAFNFVTPSIYNIFVHQKFHASLSYVLWLSIGYFFMAVYMIVVDYIFFVKKTHVLSFVTTINIALNIGLNYTLIPQYGAIGAAYSFTITMFIVSVLTFILSNKLYPMPWFFWRSRIN